MPSLCYGCQEEVSEDRYCHGCGSHVCKGCDTVEEIDVGLPYHIHSPEEHDITYWQDLDAVIMEELDAEGLEQED